MKNLQEISEYLGKKILFVSVDDMSVQHIVITIIEGKKVAVQKIGQTAEAVLSDITAHALFQGPGALEDLSLEDLQSYGKILTEEEASDLLGAFAVAKEVNELASRLIRDPDIFLGLSAPIRYCSTRASEELVIGFHDWPNCKQYISDRTRSQAEGDSRVPDHSYFPAHATIMSIKDYAKRCRAGLIPLEEHVPYNSTIGRIHLALEFIEKFDMFMEADKAMIGDNPNMIQQ